MASWTPNWGVLAVLSAVALIYVRGWLYGRRLVRYRKDRNRLICFCSALVLVFVALASPLDSFDGLFLSAHMTQHILLMMLAPPLFALSRPFLPLLRGLPKTFVKEGLGPFLAWPLYKRVGGVITAPPTAWIVFAVNTVIWHTTYFYELALRSPDWHQTQHACFFWSGILFWWPILSGSSKWPKWAFIPYLLFGDLVNTGLSAWFVFSGKAIYPSYAIVHTYQSALNDQILAGLIMWVPGSLVYLVPAFLLTVQVFAGKTLEQVMAFERVRPRPQALSILPWLTKNRSWLQGALLALAFAVMVDGWFGKQVTPVNMAGTLPWVYWRGMSMFALLVVGNVFCMACPFVFVRDVGRAFLPHKMKWPHALRNKWLAGLLFLTYLWAYEALSLWDSPWITAWLIAGYFISALLIDGFFRGASFCKYVCPIGQFHFVTSLVSPREIGIRKRTVCQSCSTFDCIKGNSTARGCELDLFQPKKESNLDCTFCLDCVKACPQDNVAIITVKPAATLLVSAYRSSIGRLSSRIDWVALILLFTFGAFVNAGGMAEPVMMWEHRWNARIGMQGMPLIVAAFTIGGAVIAPALLVSICGFFSSGMKTWDAMKRFSILLAPLGIGMWAAHVAYHALAAYVSDVTPLEILLLDAGVLISLYLIAQTAINAVGGRVNAFRLALPWATLALSLYAVGVWILLQPMQMRGMI